VLTIVVPGDEWFDPEKDEFITVDDVTLELEHSLVSLSKWESKYQKPFLDKKPKTNEETLWYIRAMTLTPNVSPKVYGRIKSDLIEVIDGYINNKMTATTINDKNAKVSNEVVTAEIIYHWMISYNIPFECQNWHLNRLITLIRICNIKNASPKKMSRQQAAARQRELNAQRRAQYGTRG